MSNGKTPADPAVASASLANDNAPAQKATKCAICNKPREHRYRPFCSRRCAGLDLARWLGGHYSVPAAAGPEDEGED